MARTPQEIRRRKQAKRKSDRKSNRRKQSILPPFHGVQSPQQLQEHLLLEWQESSTREFTYITVIRKVKWLNLAVYSLIGLGKFQGCTFEFFNDSEICGVNITRTAD